MTFLPLETGVELEPYESVFMAARRTRIGIATACAGKSTCGLCRVKLVSGEENVDPISPLEKRHLGNTYFLTKLRLSCQLRPTGDVVVEVPGLKVTLQK